MRDGDPHPVVLAPGQPFQQLIQFGARARVRGAARRGSVFAHRQRSSGRPGAGGPRRLRPRFGGIMGRPPSRVFPHRGEIMKIPSLILRQLYTFGSLENVAEGIRFRLKNRLSDATLLRIGEVKIDGRAVPLEKLTLDLGGGEWIDAAEVAPERTVPFPLRRVVEMRAGGLELEKGKHRLDITFEARPFGRLSFGVEDAISDGEGRAGHGALRQGRRLLAGDHRPRAASSSRRFTGVKLQHLNRPSFDPAADAGQHRELHRRGPGADRLRRAAARQRRARAGRVPDPAGHHRGHAGRLVQPRHQGAQPVRRRDAARWWTTACSARRSSSSSRRARRGTSSSGSTTTWTRSATRPRPPRAWPSCSTSTPTCPTGSPSCASTSRTGDAAGQNMVGRATFAACSLDPRAGRRRAHASTSSRTWPPTRRRRRSTSCARGASGSPPRPRCRATCWSSRCASSRRAWSTTTTSATSGRSSPARTTTAPTRPTPSRRCSSPPARTWPTSPSRRPGSSSPR